MGLHHALFDFSITSDMEECRSLLSSHSFPLLSLDCSLSDHVAWRGTDEVVIYEKKADKQFMRKSVEGLSIFLFFFAFCGNLTYVASILLNPAGSASPSDAGHYLLEALPYVPFHLVFLLVITAVSTFSSPYLAFHSFI